MHESRKTAILISLLAGLAACEAGDVATTSRDPHTEQSEGPISCDDVGVRGAYAFAAAPWPLAQAPPVNVAAAHAALDRHLAREQRQALACLEVSRSDVHLGLALWIRNEWNLYGMGALGAELWDYGLRHPDDASNVIAWTYIARLRGEEVDIAGVAAQYAD